MLIIKRLIMVVMLLAVPCLAQYGYVPYIQVASCSASTCAFPQNVVSGNIGIVLVSDEGTITGISDTRTSTWTTALSNTGSTARVHVYTTTFGSSGANTVTFSGGSGINATVIEMSSSIVSTTVDASAVQAWTVSTSTLTAPNVTTTVNSDIVFTYFGNNNSGRNYLLNSPNTGHDWPAGMNTGFDGIGSYISIAATNGSWGGLTVQNLGNEASGTAVTIAFKPPSPTTININSPTVLPDGVISAAYSYTLLATGGTGSYTWSVSSGTLPTGLSLNSSTGAITGTVGALASNNYNITFQVTDGTHTTTKATTLKIGASTLTPAFVQGRGGSGSNPTTTLAFSSSVTVGSVLVAHGGFRTGGANMTVCTDTLGTPFKILTTVVHSGNNGADGVETLQAGIAPSSGSDTVTCTGGFVAQIAEFSNVSFIDISNTIVASGTTGTAMSTGTMTTLVPNEMLVLGCMNYSGSTGLTVGSPFTQTESTVTVNEKMGYDLASTVTGYTGACTSAGSDAWGIGMFGLRPKAGAVVIPSTGQPFVSVIN